MCVYVENGPTGSIVESNASSVSVVGNKNQKGNGTAFRVSTGTAQHVGKQGRGDNDAPKSFSGESSGISCVLVYLDMFSFVSHFIFM